MYATDVAKNKKGGLVSKTISLDEMRQNAHKFVEAWRNQPGREKQQDQTFIRELLMVFGIAETRAALYQHDTQRSSTGRQGFFDALIPGLVAIEVKSSGKDLEAAEDQAIDYLDALEDHAFPKYVLTTDFHNFRLLNLEAEGEDRKLSFPLSELPKNVEALDFLAGNKTRTFGSFQQESASVKAAQIMGKLYESLQVSGYGEHESSVFLVRTLFCLYADDSGVWKRDQFLRFIENRTYLDGSDLGSQLTLLFQILSRPAEERQAKLPEDLAGFPYVNGDIFSEQLRIPMFDSNMRDELLKACHFNWSEISPAIFGSLFQSIKSSTARRELGSHYTTETNIRRVIGPSFIDGFEAEFKLAKNDPSRLKALRSKIGEIQILDPSCGCGNFLVVSYAALRELELEILKRLGELGDKTVQSSLFFDRNQYSVSLSQIHGIELEEWPARIAEIALFLTEHQANRKAEQLLGQGPNLLPLTRLEGLKIGNALSMDWSEVVNPESKLVIVGNPPFVGHQTKTPSQVNDLKKVWGDDYDGYLDYVTGWFKKAADFLGDNPDAKFSFVATNSISQGQPVGALFRPIVKQGWGIRFAHQSFPWSSEAPGAAAVHCVIVGMDKDPKGPRTIYKYVGKSAAAIEAVVPRINAFLMPGEDLFVEKRSLPISKDLPPVSFGTMPIDGGNLIIEKQDYEAFAADPVASQYLRRLVGSAELVRGEDRWCLWLEDAPPADIRSNPLISERVAKCKQWRLEQKESGDAYKNHETPHLFRPNSKRPRKSYLCMPRVVSERRRFFTVDHLDPEVISTDSVFTCEDPDGIAFAIASSSMFMEWQKLVGGRLEERIRFSSTVVWNNFPLPDLEGSDRDRLKQLGQGVLDARKTSQGASLADLYDPLSMPAVLVRAHNKLDQLVDGFFGLKATLNVSNEGRVKYLVDSFNMSNPSQ